MEYKKDNVRFTLPDRPTVRQQLAYFGAVGDAKGADRFVRYWEGAKTLIVDWECAAMPEIDKIDLDSLTNPSDVLVILFAGSQTAVYMSGLEDIPKNS